MDSTQIVGIAAGILTAASLIPQLVKIYKEKAGGNTAIGMLLILLSGLILWVVYGILKKDLPIIITNTFSLVINSWIIMLQQYYKKKHTN